MNTKILFIRVIFLFSLLLSCRTYAQNPYLGEIKIFAGNFPPVGWAFCEGQLLPISEHDALFNLIGTTYGGDGENTFALPDLRGRVPMHHGQGSGLTGTILGEVGGQENVLLSTANLPSHTHTLNVSNAPGNTGDPTNALFANTHILDKEYNNAPSENSFLRLNTLGNTGGNTPVNNVQPTVGMHYIIALAGVYPSQN